MDVIDRWKVMPKDPTPPIRQGFGTLGRNIPLRANYYEVKVENWKQDLVHYDVVIKEPKREEKDLVISKSRKMKIFKALEEKYSDIFKVHNLAFDGMKSAVSTGVIEEFKDGKAHQLQVEVINDRGKSNIYIIILKVVNKTSLYDLWQFLKRKKEFPATVFQLIEIMFRHTPSSNHLSIGQNSFYSFDNDWDRFRTISNGMIAAQGFFASLRPAQWKDGSLLLNVDVTHALFYKEQPVIDFMKDNDIIPRQETYLNRLLTTEEKKKLSEKLIGLKVCVTHTGCARTYKVNEILDVGASTQEFKQEKTGLSQTVLDYFADVYPRARISYPELNLLWVGALTKTVYLPIEGSMERSFLSRDPITIKTVEEQLQQQRSLRLKMKPSMVADEMFPEGAGPYMDLDEAGGSGGLLMDLTANEKAVHADFHNDFDDLFDDEDLN